MPRPRSVVRRSLATLAAGATATLLVLGVLATVQPVRAADPPRMDARALLGGHARIGTWMAIEVSLENDGPPAAGELRLAGGAQGRTRFAVPVDLPTGSRKSYTLHVQPPAFGDRVEVVLVVNDQTVASKKVAFTLHDATQLLVGIVADQPGKLAGALKLSVVPNALPPATVTLAPEDLPERVEAWGAVDRLIWQDADAARLDPAQMTALRGWLAGGGRLIVVGGTAGPAVLSGFPDAILPFRPTATVEVAAASLSGLLGSVPADAPAIVALAGASGPGRPLAISGDRVVAAERPYGNGAVALVGFDPTASWIADTRAADTFWRTLIPPRGSTGPVVGGDDSQLVSALSTLPALALPPIGGLLLLLFGYIVLIGPVNYLVLRRLDRREWAWLTIPVLIVVFAVGSYAFGAVLRGGDVLVNEVAIVRGASGTDEGLGQVYVGIFSPSRGTYQVRVPGGALLSAPTSSELIGGSDGGSLDILQGDPSRVRDLSVGFGSLRTLRAETQVTAPRISADLGLESGTLVGSVTNESDRPLEQVAVVLGGSVAVIGDVGPGATAQVHVPLAGAAAFGQSLSDRIVGPVFFGDPSTGGTDTQTSVVRHAILDQLTYDPNFGSTGQLQSDGPVLLGWADGELLAVEIDGQQPRRTGQTLYYVPLAMRIHGPTVFSSDLVRSSVVEADAAFFNKSPFDMSFGQGSVTLAYRPVTFTGTMTPTKLVIAMNTGSDFGAAAQEIEPTGPPPDDPASAPVAFDGLPEIDLFDRTSGGWVRLPHLTGGQAVAVKDAPRYVDGATGTALIRLSNQRQDGIGFQFFVRMEGDIQ